MLISLRAITVYVDGQHKPFDIDVSADSEGGD